METRQTQNFEFEFVGPAGKRQLIVTVVPLSTSSGEPGDGDIMSLIHDDTDRRRAEQALSESELRFRVALASTPTTVYTCDAELRYTWIHNPRFGLTCEQVIGRRDESRYVVSAGNLVKAEDGHNLVARIQQLAALDKAALKAEYKAQLHKPRTPGVASGAGLGLIDIARRAGAPLEASLTPAAGEGRAFFSLSVVI